MADQQQQTTTAADNTQPADRRPPVPQVSIGNVVADAGSMGLQGWTKLAGNATAMALIAGCFLFAFNYIVTTGRADRIEDRQIFRDAIRDIQTEDNRRTGEIKGAMDVNTQVMRELIAEIRTARHEGKLSERGSLPKAIQPPGDDK